MRCPRCDTKLTGTDCHGCGQYVPKRVRDVRNRGNYYRRNREEKNRSCEDSIARLEAELSLSDRVMSVGDFLRKRKSTNK